MYELMTAEAHRQISELKAGSRVVTVEEQQELVAAYGSESRPNISGVMSVDGQVATVSIQGALTPTPDFWAMISVGNTTYPQIQACVDACDSDPSIKKVVFRYNTPGGSVTGMIPAMDAIKGMKTDNEALVVGMAASAGYALASQSNRIVASDRSAMVGSIGIRADFMVSEEVVTVTSSNAPNKAPDVSSEAGRDTFRTTSLDPIEALFIEAVAQGRKVSESTVKSDFGQGGVLLAEAAKQAGMIDAIADKVNYNTPAVSGEEEATLTLEELKAQHPELHAQAVALGVKQENDRVLAHITLGKTYNAADVAFKAIEDGEGITQKLTAEYMTAGVNATALENRADDNADVTPPVTASTEHESLEAKKEAAMAKLAAKHGVTIGGK